MDGETPPFIGALVDVCDNKELSAGVVYTKSNSFGVFLYILFGWFLWAFMHFIMFIIQVTAHTHIVPTADP